MILTKDNLLRYVREKKAVIPSLVAQMFDTTTTMASAALSELAKDKLVSITYLKLSSSPYYYDPKQSEILIELGEKHLSKDEKDIFHKLKEKQVLSDNILTIQERLAINNLKDFAYPLEINFNDNIMKFWVWYQRDLSDTKVKILEALNSQNTTNNKNNNISKKEENKKTFTQNIKKEVSNTTQNNNNNNSQNKSNYNRYSNQMNNSNSNSNNNNNSTNNSNYKNNNQTNRTNNNNSNNYNNNYNNQNSNNFTKQNNQKSQKDLSANMKQNEKEIFIENFLRENYLTIQSKQKDDKGINYDVNLQLSKLKIEINCYYFYKKPNQNQMIKYYTSSLKPKIFFIENCPKNLFNFAKEIDNLIIINI